MKKEFAIILIALVLLASLIGLYIYSGLSQNKEIVTQTEGEKGLIMAESELSQVKQIVSQKDNEGIDVSGLEENINQIEVLIKRAREKIKEGDERGAREIIESIRVFNKLVIDNSESINNTFRTKVEIKSDIALPENIRQNLTQLKNSLNINKFIDLRIEIKKQNNNLEINSRTIGIENLNEGQLDLWDSIKEDVMELANASTGQEFELKVRVKRELEFENETEIEDEIEEEFENETKNSSATTAVLTREQAVQIAKSRANGTVERVEFENEDGRNVWNIRILSNSIRTDIRIDDAIGSIVRERMSSDSGRGSSNDDSEGDDSGFDDDSDDDNLDADSKRGGGNSGGNGDSSGY